MALTYTRLAENPEFVYNPFYFSLTSTNSSKLNHKFIVDVYGDNVLPSANYLGRFKFPLRPTEQIGLFSPARFLESVAQNRFVPTSSAMTNTYQSSVVYALEFGEEYDDSPTVSGATGVTVYSAITATTTLYAVNAVRQINQPHNLYTRLYSISNPTPFYMTNWDVAYNIKVRRSDWYTLTHYSIQSSNKYKVQTFDSGGTQLGTYLISAGWDASSRHFTLGVGPKNLDYSHTNTYSGGSSVIIDSNVHSYIVNSMLDSGDTTSEYVFEIIDDCEPYELIQVGYLNPWGGFDYWTFNLKNRKNNTRKNNTWSKPLAYNYSIGDLTKQNLNLDLSETLVLTTDWLKTHEAEFLKDLFFSPEIYVLNSDGSYYPVNLITKDFEQKTQDNDKLISYTFEFELNYELFTQRT